MSKKVRVLIVDDSSVSQKLYKHILIQDGRFDIVGMAKSGKEGWQMAGKLKPDVISMDINMPEMNGVEATQNIMQDCPTPIVIVSSIYQPSEVELSMKILEAGAVHIMTKPHGPGHPMYKINAQHYAKMMYLMSEIKVIRRKSKKNIEHVQISKSENKNPINLIHPDMVLIGASAGGPDSLKIIFSKINKDFSLPILLVQHIDPHFTDGYCSWLNTFSNLEVTIAQHNQKPIPGKIYLAPGNLHMELEESGKIILNDSLPVKGHRPAISRLFSSAAKYYEGNNIAILLSGMGSDGAEELKLLRNKGAYTLIQSRESCLVFGMPGEAAKLDAACKEINPSQIADELNLIKRQKL